jgi:hypothetical protein
MRVYGHRFWMSTADLLKVCFGSDSAFGNVGSSAGEKREKVSMRSGVRGGFVPQNARL